MFIGKFSQVTCLNFIAALKIVSGGDKVQVRWEPIDTVKGSYSVQDCGTDHVTHVKLNKPILIQVLCVNLSWWCDFYNSRFF